MLARGLQLVDALRAHNVLLRAAGRLLTRQAGLIGSVLLLLLLLLLVAMALEVLHPQLLEAAEVLVVHFRDLLRDRARIDARLA